MGSGSAGKEGGPFKALLRQQTQSALEQRVRVTHILYSYTVNKIVLSTFHILMTYLRADFGLVTCNIVISKSKQLYLRYQSYLFMNNFNLE